MAVDAVLLLQFGAPVAIAAAGETLTQKSGVINIGIEGQMLAGAFFGLLVDSITRNPWLGVLGAVGAALLLALTFAIFSVYLAADQVVVGTAMNLLSLGVTGTLFRAEFGQTGTLSTVPLLPNWHGLDPIVVAGMLGLCVIAFALKRTKWGLAVRAAGEYPDAVEAAGLSVHRLRMQAVTLGGMFAGLGGAYLTLVFTPAFAENMTQGKGFVAIAMVTFGRWNSWRVLVASLAVGAIGALQYWFQAANSAVPYQLFLALPYLTSLLILVIMGKGTRAPAALAREFRRSS
jgi:general nucleoside transport system permease protein